MPEELAQSDTGITLSDEIVVAEGTEFERKIKLSLPRGKHNRGVTPQIIESISGLDIIARADGNVSVSDLGAAMGKMFNHPKFISRLVPAAFGFTNPGTGQVSKDDKEWIDTLADMELFQSYLEAALYIASGGQTQEVETALKKSEGEDGGGE